MKLDEGQIRTIVEKVVVKLVQEEDESGLPEEKTVSETEAGIFPDINAAVNAGLKAQKELTSLPLKTREELIGAIREAARNNAETLARLAVDETGLGRYEDKIKKNLLVIDRTPGTEDLTTQAFSGDNGLTITERAPYGLVGSIIPITNPSETVINNSIGIIAGGNAVVFNPHPGAAQVSLKTIEILNKAIVEKGGPENLITAIEKPTVDTAKELMAHPDIKLVVVTGGPEVVKEARKSGKKVIAAGPGNPPVVVDETADIEKAGKDIVDGASLDNNIVCTDEKEVFVVDTVCDALKEAMKKNGAFELNPHQGERLKKLIIEEDKGPNTPSAVNRKLVGKDAAYYLKELDIDFKGDIRLLILETDKDHPFVMTELLMPILPIVRTKDADEAIDLALIAEQGKGHTASMFSKNIEKLSRMAALINTSVFVKNGPSYSGLGLGGEGYTSFTIATGTGEGLTTAKTFTRERRCALVDYFRIV
jgi:propionaldehyde dehydrogenase